MSYAKVAVIAGKIESTCWLAVSGMLLSAGALFYMTLIG